jgi:hypothetical protein
MVVDSIASGFGEIFSSIFREFGVLWLLIPLFILWLVLEIYFDIHKGESLGWNTALGNGITLFWITADVMRSLFERNPSDFWMRFIITGVVLLYAILIIYLSFTHKISEKWDYPISSPTPIYYIAGVTILWGYGVLEVNKFVAIDLVILFVAILIIKQILRWIMPSGGGDFGDLGGGDLGGGMGGGLDKGLGGMGDLGGGMGGKDDFKMPDMPKF